jgi:hypothetical protein
MSVDLSAAAIEARIRRASELTDLRPELRLHAKLDLTAEGIARRLRQVSGLLDLCRRLERVGRGEGGQSGQGVQGAGDPPGRSQARRGGSPER